MGIMDVFGFLKKDEDIDISQMPNNSSKEQEDPIQDTSNGEMEEIFSNKNKEARLINKNPLEDDPQSMRLYRERQDEEEQIILEAIREAKKNAVHKYEEKTVAPQDNIIKGENTGVSMQADIRMDNFSEKEISMPEYENVPAEDTQSEIEPIEKVEEIPQVTDKQIEEKIDSIALQGDSVELIIKEVEDKLQEELKAPQTEEKQANEDYQETNSYEELFGNTTDDKTVDAELEEEETDNDEDIVSNIVEENEAPQEESSVTLSPEYADNTEFAQDVLTDVSAFNVNPVNIQDMDSIDIDLMSDGFEEEKQQKKYVDAYEADTETEIPPLPDEEEVDFEKYQKLFGKVKPVPVGTSTISKVPVYIAESSVEKLNVRAGKFSAVVRTEYEEYLKSSNPEISNVNKISQPQIHTEETPRDVKEQVASAVVNFFSTGNDQIEDEQQPSTHQVVTVEDYESEEDKSSVIYEIKSNIKKLSFRTIALSIITAVVLVITVIQQVMPQTLEKSIPNVAVFYSILNLLGIGIAIAVCRVTIMNGLYPLTKLKGNSDTALSVAAVAGAIQSIVGLFCTDAFFTSIQHYYTIIVLVGFLCNVIGKLFMVLRVDKNFEFVADKTTSYSAKIYTDENVASQMMSGTSSEKPIIAYQNKTGFCSNFLQLSYSPDPSEDMASRLAPFSTLCALVIAIIYGIIYKDFVGATSAFALLSAVSMPLAALMAVNIPLNSLCKKLLRKGAMLSGYPAIKQFCDTNALMTTDVEIYPKGSVVLKAIKPLVNREIQEDLLSCAAVLREADSPMASVFDKLDSKHVKKIPDVDSVMYEDKLGLVAWIDGARLLIGNRDLLLKYGVEPPTEKFEDRYRRKHRNLTYFAVANEAVALFVTTYRPSLTVAKELQRAEDNGISILVSTNDCNVTSERISEDFGVYYRSVKVLPTGLGNVLSEKTDKTDDHSRAYIATKGKFVSLARAISGAVKIKSNISLAVVLQLIGVLIGVLIMATISLYGGAGQVGTLETLCYCVFWVIAAVVAPSIKKP